MASMDLSQFLESPLGLIQCGLALAVPAVLAAIVNIGCGKKRKEPPRRPGAAAARPGDKSKAVNKSSKAGASSKSGKSKRGTSSKSGKPKSNKQGSTKDGKPQRSTKSNIDGQSKKSKKDSTYKKDSKSSKSKKSKREVQQKSGHPSSRAGVAPKSGQAQPPSGRLAVACVVPLDNSVKSAATQRSISMKQPRSGRALDVNANVGAGGTVPIMKQDPLVPLELQLMSTIYSQKCLVIRDQKEGDDNRNVATMFSTPRSLFDSTRELKMEPAELRWSASGGMQKISLLNQSGERQAIKVKCSDNNVYRVNPVYAFVEPGQTLNVDIMRQNGSNKVDKIIFVTAKAGREENPKNLFKSGDPAASMMVLPLVATAPNNQPTVAAINN